jgi:hypothetical protein
LFFASVLRATGGLAPPSCLARRSQWWSSRSTAAGAHPSAARHPRGHDESRLTTKRVDVLGQRRHWYQPPAALLDSSLGTRALPSGQLTRHRVGAGRECLTHLGLFTDASHTVDDSSVGRRRAAARPTPLLSQPIVPAVRGPCSVCGRPWPPLSLTPPASGSASATPAGIGIDVCLVADE